MSTPGVGYMISTTRAAGAGKVMFEVVTDDLQRLTVQMRSRQTSRENIDATIRHAIDALYTPPSPTR